MVYLSHSSEVWDDGNAAKNENDTYLDGVVARCTLSNLSLVRVSKRASDVVEFFFFHWESDTDEGNISDGFFLHRRHDEH